MTESTPARARLPAASAGVDDHVALAVEDYVVVDLDLGFGRYDRRLVAVKINWASSTADGFPNPLLGASKHRHTLDVNDIGLGVRDEPRPGDVDGELTAPKRHLELRDRLADELHREAVVFDIDACAWMVCLHPQHADRLGLRKADVVRKDVRIESLDRVFAGEASDPKLEDGKPSLFRWRPAGVGLQRDGAQHGCKQKRR